METKIFSVTQLTSELKKLIEEKYPLVWVYGEISNLSTPFSGHLYFTLKDESARINAIIFKGQKKNLKFTPENGMSVIGFGRLGLYEAKGSYQIIFEYLEPKGIGSLQIAFEQLKTKLSSEGLFDDKYKKKLPFLPENIYIITSPSGSVLFDIINIINRRYSSVNIKIIPVSVQGASSEAEIVSAIKLLNDHGNSDVAIIARGGGSLEELHAFNSESVARAIFESNIPIISAIGHETDYTISDFVSDLRAPTPSAAAEIAVPLKNELLLKNERLYISLKSNIGRLLNESRHNLYSITKQIKDPKNKLYDLILKNEDFTKRLIRAQVNFIHQHKERTLWKIDKLKNNNPARYVLIYKDNIKNSLNNIHKSMINRINYSKYKINELSAKLSVLDPKAILKRGYSITRTIPEKHIILDSDNVRIAQRLEVIINKGSLICSVERKINGKDDI
ncbi:MAG: exodeoxyribonuclease VII large subunit [Proteobacteria bacterium]|nr:exodeoxyribonuclease VII large subunit [Pseudomonadota bacterium]